MGKFVRTSFRPKLKGTLYEDVEFTATGDETPSSPCTIRYNVIRLRAETGPTSIRTDKSGSQGRAEETIWDGRILVHPEVEPVNGQTVKLRVGSKDVMYRVLEVQPKYDANMKLNHYQVDLGL